jgi:metal-responsive CopG/Arc/MetJ family transcriptional regulator
MSDKSTAMGNSDMDRINVRLDARLKEQLDSAARAEGVSPSDIVRAALREHLKTRLPRPSCLDIARQIGIVGVFTDAPSDLSTNKEYFKDFGGA